MKNISSILIVSIFLLFTKTISAQCTLNLVSSTDVLCNGGNDGSLVVNMNNAVNYTLQPGNATNATGNFNNLISNTYTITGTDANFCSATTSVTIIQPPAILLNITSSTAPSCVPGCDGTKVLAGSGGVPPFTYSISPSGPTSPSFGNFIGLCAGTNYTVTSTDVNGCTGATTVTLNSPPNPVIAITSSINPTCIGGCDGSATVSPVTGGNFNISPVASMIQNGFGSLCGGITYTITVSDASGCTAYTWLTLANSLNNPSILPGVTTSIGYINASPSSGTPPYQFSLNGSPFSTTNSFNMLCSGTYTLTIKDSYGAGCLKDTIVTIVADTTFPGGSVTPFIVNPTCSLSTNGMLSLIVTPANTYQYLWNTNDTTSFLNNIGAGNFSVNIKNPANECISVVIPVSSIGSNCGNISGTVFFDSISNCMQDISEHGIPNTMIIANPGNHITLTDAFGNYAYNQLPHGTFTVSHQNNINAFTTYCGNNIGVTLSAINPNQVLNFGDSSTLSLNYSIYLNSLGCFVIPDPNKTKTIFYNHNNPSYLSTGTVYAVFDSINHYVSSIPTHTAISGDTVFWNVSNITNSAHWIQVNCTFPTTYTTANTFPFTVGLSNLQYPDTNLLNNQISYTIPFCNSYDPNDKHVAPKGEGSNGNILASDLLLTYNINFQNTGNAPAYNIVIEDTLSDKLDITSLNMLMVSHPYQLEIVNNQIIKWKFYNIMLPDSTTNEPASHGHIHYQIRQKNGNQIGDVIKNKAYIYFDYNPPIITNETVNTIYQPTGIKNTTAIRNQVVIYPNPASTEVYIDAEKEFTQFTIYNQQMSVIESQSFASTKTKKLNISTWSNGIYFIKTNNGEMKKLVVQR